MGSTNIGPDAQPPSYNMADIVKTIKRLLPAGVSGGAGTPVNPLLEKRHPEYEENREHWCFLTDSFVGGPKWLGKNIFQFHKEGPEEFKDRLRRSYRQNICREVIEIWTANLFKEAITRAADAPEVVKTFWGKVDKKGRDIQAFMEEVSDWSKAVSPCYLVVDLPARKPEDKGLVLSKADEDSKGYSKPYVYLVLPQQMLDFSKDEDDNFNWCAIEEFGRDDEDPLTSSREKIRRIRLWTRTEWSLFQVVQRKDGKEDLLLIDAATHDLGVVPVVPVAYKEGLNSGGAISLIDDIAYVDRAIANFESQLGTLVADQCFSQLFIPKNGTEAQFGRDGQGGVNKIIEMGTKRVVTFDGQGNHAPFFGSPDAAQAKFILDLIKQKRVEAYKQAILDSEGGEASKNGASTATDRAYNFKKLNGALVKSAYALQEVEKQLAKLVCLWTGEPVPDLNELVRYPKDFDVKAVADDLNEAILLQSLQQLGPSFWTAYLERLIDKVLPDAEPETKAAIMEEIRSNADLLHEVQVTAHQALAAADPNADDGTDNAGSLDENGGTQKMTHGA